MNILMINLPYSGHVNPTLPLTRELVKRGHTVQYVNAEEFRNKIENTGAIFISYINYPVHPSEMERKRSCFQAAFDTAMSLNEPFDLLIYEMFFYPGIQIAQLKNIPCVRQFSQPAWSEETREDASAFFRISARLIDLQVMGKKKAAGMGLEHKTLDEAVVYDKPDLNLVYVPEKFQNKRESFDDSYLFFTPKQEIYGKESDIPYHKMSHPIVYISLGSIISNWGFCKECIRAFGEKDVSVILNTGKIKPETLGKIPENIYAYSFVSQIEVLEHADVFLTHCGMNSVNEALQSSVPMVAMPFLNDQLTNAEQIVRLGLGKKVRSFPSRGKELYETVLEVYHSESMKNNVRKMKEELRKQPTWDEIMERIEKLTCPEDKER